MTVTGVGQYLIMSGGGEIKPVCMSDFELTPKITVKKHLGKDYCTGISTPCHTDIKEKSWELSLTSSIVSIPEGLLSMFEDVRQTSRYERFQYTGAPTNFPFYNITSPGSAPSIGDYLVRVATSALSGFVDNDQNIEADHQFYGLVQQLGEYKYSIHVPKMRRISGTQISIKSELNIRFVCEEPIVRILV